MRSILGRVALGYNDLYWCEINNAPVIIEYFHRVPYCPKCKSLLVESSHEFLGHVYKPLTRR